MLAALEPTELGGTKQWLLLRGEADHPILLVLHGGPGSADIATASRYQRELEKRFLAVNWDQHGAGKSGCHNTHLSVEQLVTDATELIRLLLARFGKQKVYLLGHSWGSALGLFVAHRYPELVTGYVGVGQLVDASKNERLSFGYVQRRARRLSTRLASRLTVATSAHFSPSARGSICSAAFSTRGGRGYVTRGLSCRLKRIA